VSVSPHIFAMDEAPIVPIFYRGVRSDGDVTTVQNPFGTNARARPRRMDWCRTAASAALITVDEGTDHREYRARMRMSPD
jgi:hypothetical protein